VSAKESACGCAGIFNAPVAMESYATVFDEENALDKLEGFASEYGPQFYGLPLNEERILLVRQALDVPELCDAGAEKVVPFHAGSTLNWKYAGVVK
jgi:dihydroorotase